MTKITTDAVLAKIPDKETLDAIDDDDMTGRRSLPVTLTLNEWRFVRARLASTSPAPDGWALPDRKVDDEDPEGFNNGWNCCLSAVRKAIGAPQPVVEKENG